MLVELFYSYAHEDEVLREELEKHLSLLKREGLIRGWHDRAIRAGADWRAEIDVHARSAQIILLLVSSDFLASDYCYDVEMKLALDRHGRGEALVIPIILRPVDWSSAPFGRLQGLPRDAKAVTLWANQDEAFADIARGIRAVVQRPVQQLPGVASVPTPAPRPLLRARDWQTRPQLEELCRWWRGGGHGACALVGIGGAGKTALADRFLQLLPGSRVDPIGVPKDLSLPRPERLFVFSFYDAPNADTFFACLGESIGLDDPGGPSKAACYSRVVSLLKASGRYLLVLDGLEKLQDDGGRGGKFGAILDLRLRDFLLDIADGQLPSVSLLATSRFPLYDAFAEGCAHQLQLDVDDLPLQAAIRLLLDRGVVGTQAQLELLIRDHGCHALTIDLIGGYIALFCKGDPGTLPPVSEFSIELGDEQIDGRVERLRTQERRFNRVAQRYHRALSEQAPAALALLERICLFRLGAEKELITSVFTGPGKESIAGSDLAALSEKQLAAQLKYLLALRLIEESISPQDGGGTIVRYVPHPVVRDAFLRGLEREFATRGHQAVSENLTASLATAPNSAPARMNAAALDTLEEVIFHTFESGNRDAAWNVFWDRIGGWARLRPQGEYQRMARICSMFALGQPPELAPIASTIPFTHQFAFMNDWGVSFAALGDLVTAARCHERAIKFHPSQQNKSRLQRSLAYVHMKAGRLGDVIDDLTKGISAARDHPEQELYPHHRDRSHAYILRGQMNLAAADEKEYVRIQKAAAKSECASGTALGYYWQLKIMLLMGLPAHLRTALSNYADDSSGTDGADGACERNLIRAEIALDARELEVSANLSNRCRDWAIAHDNKELMCWAELALGRQLMTEAAEIPEQASRRALLSEAIQNLDNGTRVARRYGFGLCHIHLMIERAKAHLSLGDATSSQRDARIALFGCSSSLASDGGASVQPLDEDSPPKRRGLFPPEKSGLPELLASTHPGCRYAWGEAEARHVWAMAICETAREPSLGGSQASVQDRPPRWLGAVSLFGRRGRQPANPQTRLLLLAAKKQLVKCRDLRQLLRDPKLRKTLGLLDAVERMLAGEASLASYSA